jgi:hypothetical protein
MLELREVKVSRGVLRGERGREASDLPDEEMINMKYIVSIIALLALIFISYANARFLVKDDECRHYAIWKACWENT